MADGRAIQCSSSLTIFLLLAALLASQSTSRPLITIRGYQLSKNLYQATATTNTTASVYRLIGRSERVAGSRSKRYLSVSIPYTYSGTSSFHLERRILISGDIEINPGPKQASPRYPCKECGKNVRNNQNAILCMTCCTWSHVKCLRMSITNFQYYLSHPSIDWTCNYCALPNFSDSFFHNEVIAEEGEARSPDAILPPTADTSHSSDHSDCPIDWFTTNITNYYKSNLTIGHLNVNGIYNKVDEIKDLLNRGLFDILFIAESKLDGTVSNAILGHPEYKIIRRDRKRGAGGLMVYIRSCVTARRQSKIEPENVESICLDIKGNNNNWFIVLACYRSPNKCKIPVFIASCKTAAENMLKKRKEVVFLGDFNLDMFVGNDNSRNPNAELSDFCDQFCLTNTINEPTRVTISSATLIDVILVSHPHHWSPSGTIHLGISDNDLVYIVRKQRLPKAKAKTFETRSMKRFEEMSFLSDLAAVPWDSAFVFNEVDDVWAHWSCLYKQVLDKHAPTTKKIIRGNQLPWITRDQTGNRSTQSSLQKIPLLPYCLVLGKVQRTAQQNDCA